MGDLKKAQGIFLCTCLMLMSMGVAREAVFTSYDTSGRQLVVLSESPTTPHVERRVNNGVSSLVIHHSAGTFVLHPGFSPGSIGPETQEGLVNLYRTALGELCRWVEQGS